MARETDPVKESRTTAAAAPRNESLLDPRQWVEQYGDILFRYALVRVGDPEVAKDLVQEALLGAVQAMERFSGRSSPKTWLIGILKHKIVDHFRKRSRDQADPDPNPEEAIFRPNGRWQVPPADWRTDPAAALDRKEFWEALSRCLAQLPPRQASAFSLRELEGLSTQEICKVFETTATNAWVLLHRARMALQQCLQAVGFGTQSTEGN